MFALAGIAEIFCRCRDDPAAANPAIPLLTCVLARTHKRCHCGALEISDAIAPSLEARTKVAARPSRLKSKAGPAERHPGVLWKPQRFVQVRIVKNVPEMIDDLAISPKLIRKHKLDRSQHECEKCVVAVQQHGFYRRRTDEIA